MAALPDFLRRALDQYQAKLAFELEQRRLVAVRATALHWRTLVAAIKQDPEMDFIDAEGLEMPATFALDRHTYSVTFRFDGFKPIQRAYHTCPQAHTRWQPAGGWTVLFSDHDTSGRHFEQLLEALAFAELDPE